MFLDIGGKRPPIIQGRLQQVDDRHGVEAPNVAVDEVFSKKE